MSKPSQHKWKTKGSPKDRDYVMICMNSEPEFSKYPEAAPEGGCNEWVHVADTATAVLCSKCVQRLMTKSPVSKSYDSE